MENLKDRETHAVFPNQKKTTSSSNWQSSPTKQAEVYQWIQTDKNEKVCQVNVMRGKRKSRKNLVIYQGSVKTRWWSIQKETERLTFTRISYYQHTKMEQKLLCSPNMTHEKSYSLLRIIGNCLNKYPFFQYLAWYNHMCVCVYACMCVCVF